MSLNLSEGGNFTPAPAGLHSGICVMVVDLGHQSTPFGIKPKVLIGWELPEVLMDDGKPYVITRQFGATLSKQGALRPIIDAWRGRGLTAEEARSFDLSKLVGKPCKLLIQHVNTDDGKTYANVQAAIKPEVNQPTVAQSELLFYDHDQPNLVVKPKLPAWIQKLIDGAVEVVKPEPVKPPPAQDFDDDITF
jgi:hypothetical protein